MTIRSTHTTASIGLTVVALAFLGIFVALPLVTVFVEALSKGIAPYFSALVDPDAVSAIKLTLTVAAIAVPLNIVFGIAAAWAIAKFDFPGNSILITFIVRSEAHTSELQSLMRISYAVFCLHKKNSRQNKHKMYYKTTTSITPAYKT